MSLASGFESGFNLALKFGSFKEEQKEKEKRSNLLDVQIEGAESDIKIQQAKLNIEQEKLVLDKAAGAREDAKANAYVSSYVENGNYRKALGEKESAIRDKEEFELGESKRATGHQGITTVLGKLGSLPDDPSARKEDLYYMASAHEKIKRDYGVSLIDVVSPTTAAALNNLQPVLASGDFSSIGPSFKDDLSTIYKNDLNAFVGKKFLSTDGKEGTIKKVMLNGDIVGKDMGVSAVIGAEYTVEIDGEEQNFTGFLPDSKQGIVKQDLEGVDAKSVSVRDATDRLAVFRTIHSQMYQNPKMIEGARDLANELGKSADEKNNKIDNVAVRGMYEDAMEVYTDAKFFAQESGGLDLSGSYEGQETAVNTAIKTFAYYLPELKVETNEDGLAVIPKQYEGNLGKYFSSVQPSYDKYVAVVSDNQNALTVDLKEGQKRFYLFGSEPIPFNTSRDDYLSALTSQFGPENVNVVVERGEGLGLNDEELLDYLYNELIAKNQQR